MQNKVIRAKQFMPFEALKGLKEALKNKEKEIEKKYIGKEKLNNK